MPTVREIAELAQVSKSTVSLVLNNKAGVSETMRRRVLEAAEQLREREGAANPRSRAQPSTDNSHPISVVLLHPYILRSSQVFSEFLQGLEAGASLYQIQLRLAAKEDDLRSDHITHLYFSDPDLLPDGVLVIGARLEEPLLNQVHALGIPCVLVGRQSVDPRFSAVGRGEEAAACQATQHLLDLGHKNIAFVGGDPAYSYTNGRLSGYQAAFRERDIAILERWIALGDGQTAATQILDRAPEVTAALVVNDAYAMEALPVFEAAGLNVPDDLSVISFDDTVAAQDFSPPLTSVSFARYEEGFWSVKVLVDHIRQPLMQHCQIVFRASLIERASCAPPRTNRLFRSEFLEEDGQGERR
jgi:DNA-binding LacI/PurR family transcriptional regulator